MNEDMIRLKRLCFKDIIIEIKINRQTGRTGSGINKEIIDGYVCGSG